jgi:hypothetical protein
MKKAIRWILGVIGAMVAVPLVGFALLLLSRFGLMAQKIHIAGGDRCWNVPATARNIYAKGSHLHFAAEFEITEKELVEYCQMRGWGVAEIATPVSARTYRAYGDSNAEEAEITVAQGLVHDSMTHRGGFKVVFDRAVGKAFLEFSHN